MLNSLDCSHQTIFMMLYSSFMHMRDVYGSQSIVATNLTVVAKIITQSNLWKAQTWPMNVNEPILIYPYSASSQLHTTMSLPRYQPVPQHELPAADTEQLKPEPDDDLEDLDFEHDHRRAFSWKRLLFLLLSMAAFFQASYLVGKKFVVPTARARLGTPCRGSGKHRNFSSAVNGARLQRYFTLPSGDKIPAVALGAPLVSFGPVEDVAERRCV